MFCTFIRRWNTKETLKEHTQRSQKYWLLIAKNKCIDEIMERFEEEYFENLSQDSRNIFEEMTINIVTMHDLGKVNPAFQKKRWVISGIRI